MVNATTIQQKVNFGYGKAGAILGDPYAWYRANGPTNPTAAGNQLGSVTAAFSTDPALNFAKPSQYGKPDWYGAFDATNMLSGDYLIGLGGTFFLTDIERFTAPHVIRCARTVAVLRMQSSVVAGISPNYGGDVLANSVPILSGWPASILNVGSKGAPNAMQLPNDSKMGTMTVLLPSSVPAPIFANDLVQDDLGNGFAISAAELTALGWRLTVDQWLQG